MFKPGKTKTEKKAKGAHKSRVKNGPSSSHPQSDAECKFVDWFSFHHHLARIYCFWCGAEEMMNSRDPEVSKTTEENVKC